MLDKLIKNTDNGQQSNQMCETFVEMSSSLVIFYHRSFWYVLDKTHNVVGSSPSTHRRVPVIC